MKSTLKDVVLLCKGYYDKEKYKTIFDALKEYYKQYYCSDMDFGDKWLDALLKIVLEQSMRELSDKYPDRLYGFINGYLMFDDNLYIRPKTSIEKYEEVLFYRIVNFFNQLKMCGDGIIEINTNDYFKVTHDENTGENSIELLEKIIQ